MISVNTTALEAYQIFEEEQMAKAMAMHVTTIGDALSTPEERIQRALIKLRAKRVEKQAEAEASVAFAAARERGMAKAIESNLKGEIVSNQALISRNKGAWPTAEKDLKEASRNGLKSTAHTGTKNRWHEGAALQWAAANNKLLNRSMATLPGRAFRQS